MLCQRVRRTSQFLEEVLFEEGPMRLAKRLVYLAEVFGQPTKRGIRIDIPLSQQQLGNVVGMSRESINKQLRLWHTEGLVEWDHGYYTILDLEALRGL
jgi:CRP-like cAMP-binding protein